MAELTIDHKIMISEMGGTKTLDLDELGDEQFEGYDANREIEMALEALTDEGDYESAADHLSMCADQITGDDDMDPDKYRQFVLAFEEIREDLDADTLRVIDEILMRIDSKMKAGE